VSEALVTHPLLTCSEALAFEQSLLGDDAEAEWQAMRAAGEGLADCLLRDMRELRTIPHRPRFLFLVGKGHNGGDALVAAKRLLRSIPTARACLWPVEPWNACKPNVQRARDELLELAAKRVEELEPLSSLASPENIEATFQNAAQGNGFHACLDGLLGMQFRPPVREPISHLLGFLNDRADLGFRASVDLPSGVGDETDPSPFRADFTYATGIAKAPLLASSNAQFVGRIRYVDVGFFDDGKRPGAVSTVKEILLGSAIRTLRKLRPAHCDKRDFGHLFLLAGSRTYPGAALMAAKAAIRSGVGLLTAFVPESLQSSFAAALPEAMWVPMPETPEGGLALEGRGLVVEKLSRATALVAGPGLGTERETQVLLSEILKEFDGPVILDADALQPEIIAEAPKPERLALTPHAGEFARLSGGADICPRAYSEKIGCATVLKGPLTRICSSGREVVNISGGPVLARGGSGDLLAGIIGSLAARGDRSLFDAAALGVLWHGRAADTLARQHGQEAVNATELLDYLSFSLRNDF
jgi:hydroxyethylthiazole kinase-like uncharacterized protein yjeF